MRRKHMTKMVGIILAALLVFTLLPLNQNAEAQTISVDLKTVNGCLTNQSLVNSNTPQTLQLGCTSTRVANLENALCKLGYLNKSCVNNYFGTDTQKAIGKFQKNCGLPVTGKADLKTCSLLINKCSQKPVVTTKNPSTPKTPAESPKTPSKPGNQDQTPAPTPSPAPTPKPEQTPTPAPNSAPVDVKGLTADEQKRVNLVNQERAKQGLKPLQVDMQLVKLARMKSQDMIDKNYFGHQSPTYGSPFDMMKSAGVSFKTADENLAGAGSVEVAHQNLMNSSGHRANILNKDYTHIGIGIVNGGKYGKMYTQLFVGR